MKYYRKTKILFPIFLVIPTFLLLVIFYTKAVADEDDDVLLSVEEAISLKNDNPRTIYIDVRNQELFDEAHIPTSINIPLHFVKTKQYLKNMVVILVNEGYFPEPLHKEHDRLAKLGFNTHILAGGIAAWNQQGQQLAGTNFPTTLSLHTAPANLMLPGIRSNNIQLFIDISVKSQEEIIPETISIPAEDSRVIKKITRFIEEKGLDEKTAVLIFNQDGNYQILDDLPSFCRPTIFFLEGGISAYQTALENTQAMLQPKEKRIKKIGGCATCPPAKDINKDN